MAKKPAVFLMETPEAKSLLLLLECFQRDFPPGNPDGFPGRPQPFPEGFGLGEDDWNPHLWDQVSKEAAVVEGKESWLDRLQAYQKLKAEAARDEEEEDPDERSLSLLRTQVLKELFDQAKRFEKAKAWSQKAQTLLTWPKKFSCLPKPRPN